MKRFICALVSAFGLLATASPVPATHFEISNGSMSLKDFPKWKGMLTDRQVQLPGRRFDLQILLSVCRGKLLQQ